MSQTFFLTGCASGMGRHMTTALQRRGHRIFATDVNIDALEKAREEQGWQADKVHTAALNVVDSGAWERVFADAVTAFGGIDVTMNIAGLLLASWAHESPIREIDLQIDVNVKGVIFGSRVSAQHMLERGSGHIVNIASVAGLVPAPGLSTYCATKYAVRAYSIAAAYELRPKNVFVTAVCPATIQTPLLDNQLHNDAAEMFFSGRSILTLEDIEAAFFDIILPKRPYEFHIPWGKAKLAQFANLFPAVAPVLTPLYQRSGRRRQSQRRSGNTSL